MKNALVVVLAVLALTACKKPQWKNYYALRGQQEVLLARDGEDAYLSDEMQQIITALDGAPPDCREAADVTALSTRLKTERERLGKEREARMAVKTTPIATPTPTFAPLPMPTNPTPPNEPAAGATDAGPPPAPTPYKGMSEAEFETNFGKCFEAAAATTGPAGQPATGRKLKSDITCQRQFGGSEGAETVFVFLPNAGLDGSRTTSTTSTTTRTTEPGKPAPPAPPPTVERTLVVPGTPQQ